MKSLHISLAVLVALAVAPALYAGDFGIRAGRYNDLDEQFVGADVLIDLGSINVNPNIEYSLADNTTAGSVNVDVTIDIANIGPVTPYVGAGVGLQYVDPDAGDNTTDILGNLIGGVAFHLESLTPYAQVKYFRVLENQHDGADAADDIALTVGLRF